jgi:hypothetical protein
MKRDEPSILSKREVAVLTRYKTPGIIDEKDRDLIHRLAMLHFAELGFHENDDGSIHETVKLTDMGKRLLHLSRILDSPSSLTFFRRLDQIRKMI